MTQLSESVKRSRKRRQNKVARLRMELEKGREEVYRREEIESQFQQNCRDIWVQCNGNRKVYRQLVEARRKFLMERVNENIK